MTLAAGSIVNSYLGNNSTNAFAFTFPVFSQSDLAVIVTSPSNVVYTLVLGTDYTVSGLNPSGGPATGGTVTLVNAGTSQNWLTGGNLLSGYIITITRSVSLAQLTSIRNQGDFYQEVIENAFDYLMMAIQQLNQAISSPILPAALNQVQGNISLLTNGSGIIFTTPNGAHTYQYAINNNGTLTITKLT